MDALCENPLVYPNLNNERFYFVGDSIFGNDTGVLSIPGMISGLTDATTFNYGVGGATAAICSTAPTNFKEICESNDFPGYTSATVFINFGLNDYMQGVSVEAYKKALIDQTSRLMKANKDLRIIILSPSYCTFFEEGTIPQGTNGSPLQDYRVAAKEAADSLGVELFDSYTILGFDASNADLYLADGCHMTEAGRFIMSQKLIEFFTSKTDD